MAEGVAGARRDDFDFSTASQQTTDLYAHYAAFSREQHKRNTHNEFPRGELIKRPHYFLRRWIGTRKVHIRAYAKVYNPRLATVYTVLMGISWALVFAQTFLLDKLFVDEQLDDSDVFTNLQVAPKDRGAISDASDKVLESNLCQNPDDYKYISSSLSFQNITCTTPCRTSLLNASCQHEHRQSIAESASQIFLVSSRAVFQAPDWKNAVTEVYTGLEGLEVDVNYGYNLVSKDDWPIGVRAAMSGVSQSNMATVVRKINRKIWKVIGPPARLKLKLTDLATLAGIEGAFDDGINANAANNEFESPAGSGGPLWRLSGMHLTIKIKCVISTYSRVRAFMLGHGGHVPCDLSVAEAGQNFTNFVDSATEPFLQTGVLYYGVRVTLAVSGRYCYFTWANFIQMLAGITVYLLVPSYLLRWMSLGMMGITSEMYNRLLNPLFHIREQIGSIAMRYLINTFYYEELETTDDHGNGIGIQGQRFREGLIRFLSGKDGQISDLEVLSFSDFVFWVIAELPWRSGAAKDSPEALHVVETIGPIAQAFDRVVSSMTGSDIGSTTSKNDANMTASPAKSAAGDLRIRREAFLQACSSLDMVSFENLIEFFNTDRRIGFLEFIFSPGYVRAFFEQGKFDALEKREAFGEVVGATDVADATDSGHRLNLTSEFAPLVRKKLLVSMPIVERLRASAVEGLEVIKGMPSSQNVYEIKGICSAMAVFVNAGAASENRRLRSRVNQLDTALDKLDNSITLGEQAEVTKRNLRFNTGRAA